MTVETRVAWRPDAYAGFWQRVGGWLIDGLIFFVLLLVVGFVLGLTAAAGGAADPEAVADSVGPIVNLIGGLAFLVYDVVLTGRTGATLGKRAAGIEVRRTDGTLPSYGLLVGRYFARILSWLPLFIGFLWPVFDQKKQTFHDKIVSTVVVQRALIQPAGGAAGWGAGATGAGSGWGGAPTAGAGWGQGSSAAPPPGQGWGQGSSAAPPPGQGWGPPGGDPGGAPDGAPAAVGRPGTDPSSTEQGGGWLSGDSMETAQWGRPQPTTPDEAAAPAPGAVEPSADADADAQVGAEPGTGAESSIAASWEDPADAGAEPAAGPPPAREEHEPSSEEQEPAGEEPVAEQPGADPRWGVASWGDAGPAAASPAPAGDHGPAEDDPPPAGELAGPSAGSTDPNVVAVERAGLSSDAAGWLQQVAGQVDPRLDRIRPDWRQLPQADAARACAFGILLGHLARLHPHMRDALGRVAEVHPSFSTLLEGSRLATLEQIAEEPGRATAWLGPLLDVEDRDRIGALLA